jgi:hypothetical protein
LAQESQAAGSMSASVLATRKLISVAAGDAEVLDLEVIDLGAILFQSCKSKA